MQHAGSDVVMHRSQPPASGVGPGHSPLDASCDLVVAPAACELGDRRRVPAGLGQHRRRHIGAGRATGDRGQQVGDLIDGQPRQPATVDRTARLRLAGRTRINAFEAVAPHAHHHHGSATGRGRQVFEEEEAVGSGLIQVIEYRQHRRCCGEVGQRLVDCHRRLTVVGVRPGRAADRPQQGLGGAPDRLVVAVVAAGIDHHRAPGVHPSGELGQQAGLADSGGPHDQAHLASGRDGLLPEHLQPAQLGLPAHERSVGGRQLGWEHGGPGARPPSGRPPRRPG